ncbi:MAG TPA: tetratricopeptide repeat protein [Dehalococcoidia bacterium]|nr:tetratricopeptide repeat protein [Dehalococcoidia bacterium]
MIVQVLTALPVVGVIGAAVACAIWLRTRSNRLTRIESQLGHFTDTSANPPTDPIDPDLKALAVATTRETQTLLAEAVMLYGYGKKRDAIGSLLTAYGTKLAPPASFLLHTLAGNGFYRLSDFDGAEREYQEALSTADDQVYVTWRAAILVNLALAKVQQEKSDAAKRYYEESLALRNRVGDELGEAAVLILIGDLETARGQADHAEKHYAEGFAIYQRLGRTGDLGRALASVAYQCLEAGEPDRAQEKAEAALAIHREIKDPIEEFRDLSYLGHAFRQRFQLARAEEYYHEALAVCRRSGYRLGEGIALGNLGNVYNQRGDLDLAEVHYKEAGCVFKTIGAEDDVAKTERALKHLGVRPT